MNNIFNLFVLQAFLLLNALISYGQVTISNASFEGQHADATMPSGWYSESEGTTPDILPGYWGVYKDPSEGESYIGLITRSNGTFESIGQRLESPLNKDLCYKFNIDLAYSDNYSGYNHPLHLRIWVSNKKGKRQQLIYESLKISHTDWKTYKIEFRSEDEANYIILEAFINEKPINYKGNILIDNMTFISNCNRV